MHPILVAARALSQALAADLHDDARDAVETIVGTAGSSPALTMEESRQAIDEIHSGRSRHLDLLRRRQAGSPEYIQPGITHAQADAAVADAESAIKSIPIKEVSM